MDAIEALRSRRSGGRLEGELADSEIRGLIELATCAPNHHLTEPWRFTVIRGAALDRLADAWAQIAVRELPLTGEAREAARERETGKVKRAPLLLAVSVRTDPDPVTASEDFAAAAAAVENILIAATARGIGAMWRTGGMAYDAEIKAFLGLEPSDRIVAFVNLGRSPAMPVSASKAREIEGVTRWLE